MYIKISSPSQLEILQNVNVYMDKNKIPREVLHNIGLILGMKTTCNKDYVVLFIEPLKNDTADILNQLQLYPATLEMEDNNISAIHVKGKRHPMKKNRTWCYYDIKVVETGGRIFAVYSLKDKYLDDKGGF